MNLDYDSLIDLYRTRSNQPLSRIPVIGSSEHTMSDDLDLYVDQRVPVDLIQDAVSRGIPISIHGIYPSHFDLVAENLGLRINQALGSNCVPGKELNGVRPEHFDALDAHGRRVLCAAVPPGHDYLMHYSSLVVHAMNRQASDAGLRATVWHYPLADEEIARWTRLGTMLPDNPDVVIFGKIELLSELLEQAGFERTEHATSPHYDAMTFHRPGGRKVTLLGVRFSYWGSLGARLAEGCCARGAKEIIYVGKLGTLFAADEIYCRIFVPSRYGVLSGVEVRELSPGPPNRLRDQFPGLSSGLHVSVPTVLEENYSQRELARLLGASTMDNELAQMAIGVHHWNLAHGTSVNFSGLHYATDYLRKRDEFDIEIPYSLARARSDDARRKRRRAERLIGDCMRTYLASPVAAAA